MKKREKDSDNFRQRKLTLKIRKLQTAEDKKQFKIVCIKKYFPYVYAFMYISIVLGEHCDPPQPWTLF